MDKFRKVNWEIDNIIMARVRAYQFRILLQECKCYFKGRGQLDGKYNYIPDLEIYLNSNWIQ